MSEIARKEMHDEVDGAGLNGHAKIFKTKETKNGTRRGVVAEVKKKGVKLKPVSSMLFAK